MFFLEIVSIAIEPGPFAVHVTSRNSVLFGISCQTRCPLSVVTVQGGVVPGASPTVSADRWNATVKRAAISGRHGDEGAIDELTHIADRADYSGATLAFVHVALNDSGH